MKYTDSHISTVCRRSAESCSAPGLKAVHSTRFVISTGQVLHFCSVRGLGLPHCRTRSRGVRCCCGRSRNCGCSRGRDSCTCKFGSILEAWNSIGAEVHIGLVCVGCSSGIRSLGGGGNLVSTETHATVDPNSICNVSIITRRGSRRPIRSVSRVSHHQQSQRPSAELR